MNRICPTAPTPQRRRKLTAEVVDGDVAGVIVLAKAIAVVQLIRARRRKLGTDGLARRLELARCLDTLRKLCGERKERGL